MTRHSQRSKIYPTPNQPDQPTPPDVIDEQPETVDEAPYRYDPDDPDDSADPIADRKGGDATGPVNALPGSRPEESGAGSMPHRAGPEQSGQPGKRYFYAQVTG